MTATDLHIVKRSGKRPWHLYRRFTYVAAYATEAAAVAARDEWAARREAATKRADKLVPGDVIVREHRAYNPDWTPTTLRLEERIVISRRGAKRDGKPGWFLRTSRTDINCTRDRLFEMAKKPV
jgi:hypothetical protein